MDNYTYMFRLWNMRYKFSIQITIMIFKSWNRVRLFRWDKKEGLKPKLRYSDRSSRGELSKKDVQNGALSISQENRQTNEQTMPLGQWMIWKPREESSVHRSSEK